MFGRAILAITASVAAWWAAPSCEPSIAPRAEPAPSAQHAPSTAAPTTARSSARDANEARSTGEHSHASSIGFSSRRTLEEHFAKHGAELHARDADEYARLAIALRDAPLNRDVLQARRSDGVTTRFDAKSGAFIAFQDDGTIRTFFVPNDGRDYFMRQLTKEH